MMNIKKNAGFTLIELLIVIGLLGALTQDQVDSLAESGVTSVCYGEGLNSQPLAAGSVVMELLDSWLDDTPAAYTFDGQTLAEWRSKIDGGGTIIVLWVAPTTDWSNKANPNKDWSGGNVEIGMDIDGQCPIPGEDVNGNDPEFAYYMAYFLVDNDSSNGVTPAELIGASCPECGVMNP